MNGDNMPFFTSKAQITVLIALGTQVAVLFQWGGNVSARIDRVQEDIVKHEQYLQKIQEMNIQMATIVARMEGEFKAHAK